MTGLTFWLRKSQFLKSESVDEMSRIILRDCGRNSLGLLHGECRRPNPENWDGGKNSRAFTAIIVGQNEILNDYKQIIRNANVNERIMIREAIFKWRRNAHHLGL